MENNIKIHCAYKAVRTHFERIGYRYTEERLRNAVIKTLDMYDYFPTMTLMEAVKTLYPNDIVPLTETEWTVDLIRRHFIKIGKDCCNTELRNATICVIDAHRCFPALNILAIIERLYPEDEFVPSPS